jgi:hypothetical protein
MKWTIFLNQINKSTTEYTKIYASLQFSARQPLIVWLQEKTWKKPTEW